jgi:acetyltransferase-like isoleucine patch superfamily enzyme
MGRFKNWSQPVFDTEGYAYLGEVQKNMRRYSFGWRCFHPENLSLGRGCDVGAYTLIQAKYGVEIEEGVEIGPFCYICSWSTEDNKMGKVIIRRNAKIGAHSTIMPGITVGENSIVGAYSFVNKNILPDVTAFGIPCKVKVCKKKSLQSIKQD